MRSLRRLFHLVSIGLTALMTLIAATPHFHCICPNCHVKPFCLSIVARDSCCVPECCATSAAESEHDATDQVACCCLNSARRISGEGQQLASGGCTKTLIDAEVCTIPSAIPDGVPANGIGTWMAPLGSPVLPPAAGTRFEPLALLAHRSPPPDLITLLQHFII